MNIVKSIFFRAVLVLMVFTTGTYAQINTPAGAIIPFGSNPSYANGMMPTNLPTGGAYGKSTDAANAYNTWKANYIVSCASGTQYRVKFDDPNQTVSEGIAYGMLLAAYAADKTLFDGLWAYYKANVNGNGVMNWRITGCNSTSGSNGATDAELDAALALLVADAQWPLATSPYDYTTEATSLINKIKNTEMDAANHQATNGDAWGTGTDCRNPSYQAPAYYRLFAAAIPADATFWGTNAVNGAYTLVQANAHATTGLVSDWSNKAGATSACQSGSTSGLYGYDACRNPWRMGTDYIWNAEARARTQCDKIASYVNSQGAANCGGPRQQNGSGSGGHYATFVSTYATAIMGATPGTYQTLMNAMYTQTVGVSDFYQNAQPSGYFGNTLRCVSLFMMTGNFWKPGTSLTQEINVQRAGTNIASGSTIDLGNVQQGTNGDFTFTIQNLGATALSITNPITISGAGAAKYSIQTAPGTTVAANGTTTFVLRCTPGAGVTGPFNAALSITNNDANENPYVINVLTTGTATATAPEIDVQVNSISYASGSTFNLGNVTQGATAYQVFNIKNTGTANLTISTAPVTGTGYAPYGTNPTTIAAGASANIMVSLNSATTGTRTGTITINNNDGNEAAYLINLTANVVTCAASITASQVLQDHEANNNTVLDYAPTNTYSLAAVNPSIGGLNTSQIVSSITRSANTYQGFRYKLGCGSTGNFDMTNPVVSILIYSPAAGIPVLLSPKLSTGNPVLAASASDVWNVTTKVNQWERLYFDMSKIAGSTAVRFLDVHVDPDGTSLGSTMTYYLDDLRYDVVACITSLPSSKVFMDYDGERNLSFVYPLGNAANSLKEVFANPSATGINTSANVARFIRYNGAGSTYQGWRYSGCQNKIDLSTNPIISMKVRTATANVPITMSFTDAAGTYIGGATVNSGPANTWNKLYFDATAIQNSTTIAFMDIYPDAAGAFLSNTTYYFDDIRYDVLPCASPATANAGTDITICSGGSATLAGSITNATGSTWSGGFGTFTPNATTLTASYTPSAAEEAAGIATLTLTTTGMGSGCTAASDQVVINISSGLTTSAAGSDQTVCTSTATLAGNTPTTGTGAWTVVTGTAVVTTPSSPTSGVTGLVVGSATLRWTISGSGCTPSTDDVVITRIAPPTANANSDQTICNTGTATLAGSVTGASSGTWSGGTGTFAPNAGTLTAVYTPSAAEKTAGSAVLTLTTDPVAGCTAATDQMTITIVASPTASAAGSDQTICATTATLAANAPTVGTGAWTVVSGTATVTTTSSPTSGVTAIGVGTATLRWTISNSPCTASFDDVIITRTAAPTASAAGSDQTICATTATLAANTPTTGTGVWTVVSGTVTVTNTSSPTSGVTAIGVGSATLRWTISNSPCTASFDDVVITRNADPTISAAGSDQSICATTATLAANAPTVGTGVWTVVSGTATVTNTSSPTSGVTAIGVGSATLRWTISNSPCTASFDDVVITRNDVPTASAAGSDQSICATTATLAANTPTVGTGVWTVVSGTATVTNTSSPTSGVTAIGVGSATLRWTISNSPCTASFDDVIITRTAAPTISAAGSDQTICATTATLAANAPTTGTGAWTVVSGTATVTNTSSPTSGVTAIGVGSATLRWTISNSPCTASFDEVVITRNDVPTTSAAGSDQSICATTTTLAGNTAAIGTGTWTVVSGTATFTTASSPTSGVTGLSVGSNTLRWTISNSPCTASFDDVVINVTGGLTAANAGGDQTVCAATATLAGNTPTTGTGAWSVVSGTANITNTADPVSAVTGLVTGSATLRWTISLGGCTPSTDDVVITRNATPTTSSAGSDQTICSATATLAGNTPATGTGAWTVISGTATVTTPSSPTSGVTGLVTGSATLRWTISNAPCVASMDDVVITVTAAPTTSSAGSDQSLCASTTATLAGNTPTTGTGAWTVISGTATVTTPTSPSSGVTGLVTGSATLRWTISNTPCAASTDDVVITVVNNPTTAAAGSDQSICATSTTLAGNTASTGTGSWSVVSGSATFTTASSPTSAVTGLGIGANTLRWTISNTPCAASTDDVVINVTGGITTADAGIDQNVLLPSTSATLGGNTPSSGTGAWSVVSGTATITTASNPTSGVTGLGAGYNVLRWTISNGGCTPSTDDVSIFVGSTPGATTITGPSTVTANQTNVTYTFSPVNPGSVYTWTVPAGSTIVSSGPGTVTITFGSTPGNVSLTETNPLGSHTSDLPITIGATGVLYGLGTDSFEAYPSPFEDVTNLKINSTETVPMKVKVVDSKGIVIYSGNNFFTNQNITIGKEFSVGVYYVEVSYQNKMQIIKLVKM